MHRAITFGLYAIAAGMLLYVLAGTSKASAVLTPALCDPSPPKYHCSRIQFVRVTGGYTIQNYQHRGAIDGGAEKWRRYYIQETAWPSGSFLHNVSTTAWMTNVSLPSSYTSVARNVTYYQHINVHFGFQFHECTPQDGCYFWWGDSDQIMLAT